MRCLLGCFRVADADADGGGREVKRTGVCHGQLVAPSLVRMKDHEVRAGKRARPPSRNALSAVFLREDEVSNVELTATFWADQSEDRKRDKNLKHETIMQEGCGSSLESTNEPQGVLEDADSVHQTECGPSMFDNVHFMEGLNVDDHETPARFHQSSSVPDATSSSKANEKMPTPDTSNVTDLEGLTKDANEYHVVDPAEEYKKCGVSRPKEDFISLDQPTGYPNCEKNDNSLPIEITVSEECSFFQSSEDSVSSFKLSDCTGTTAHSTRKVLKNSDSELQFPSLSQWLKPPNPKKPFMDEVLAGNRSAKSSDEDRPIIGMVAAHWKDEEPEKFTPKWWDGNGIPNLTNKYKEDQMVCWHAMSFEERLEKALSEEKLLSERNYFSGNTSQVFGMEGEQNDTAESNHLYAAAHA